MLISYLTFLTSEIWGGSPAETNWFTHRIKPKSLFWMLSLVQMTQGLLWLCELDLGINPLGQKLWNPSELQLTNCTFTWKLRWKSSALSAQTSGSFPDQEYFNEMRLKWIVDISIKCCHLISTVCLICKQLWNVIRTRELYWGLPHYRNGFPEGSELICLKIKCIYINTWGKQTALQT